ncbi:MAG: phenylalanine--tRNA ligase subunit beta [Mycobacterium sp.]
MRVPLSWLAEFVDLEPGTSAADVQAALVGVGFEEEDVHTFEISGPVVVGEVLEFVDEPQSNGKTIRWCQVNVGPSAETGIGDVRGIVCGAHNFEVGDRVVVTLPGSVLPGPFPIAARTTYGHVSDGMIASTRELGIGDEHDGILVLSTLGLKPEPGTDAIALLGLDDSAVEVNVTPDRGYALSIRGIAREYSHATGAAFRDPATAFSDPAGDDAGTAYPVVVDDRAPIRGRIGCTVFVARVVRGVEPGRPSPAWLVSRLALAGIRSISLIVDVTNYVMLELGQPIHGYDLDKLTGSITVRRAEPGETLTTLDDKTRTLDAQDLLITDESGPIGLAGVMGGTSTEITDDTADVLVEAANFDPVSVARTARRHKLPSEAAKRFERGVDPRVADAAAARVVQLLVELAGGQADGTGSVHDETTAHDAIDLPGGFVAGLIGVDYTADEIRAALAMIGTRVEETENGLQVTPPSWRPDLRTKWDLAEEVARINGYDRIPSVLPVAPPGHGLTHDQSVRRQVAQTLAATGHTEVLAYPFVSAAANELFGSVTGDPVGQVKIANPLDAEAGWLRTSLLPGLVQIAARNRSRGLTDLSLFEIGVVFLPEAGREYGHPMVPAGVGRPSAEVEAALNAGIPPQPRHVGVLLTGHTITKQPGNQGAYAAWTDALEAVQQVALATGVPIGVRQSSHPGMHPGRCAELFVETADGASVVGFAGEVLPQLAASFDFAHPVAVAELDLDRVIGFSGAPVIATPVGTQTAATQDLSLVVEDSIAAGDVLATVIEGAGPLLENAVLVDDYRGSGLPDGTKSLTFALRFRAAERTLTAAEATEAKLAGVALARQRHNAQIRD